MLLKALTGSCGAVFDPPVKDAAYNFSHTLKETSVENYHVNPLKISVFADCMRYNPSD